MTEQRNIVLVTVDSLRADHCGFMGDDRGLTPNLDHYAEEGLVFENAVTPGPSTLDALPAIFTGRDLPDGEGDTKERLQHHMQARETIPEKLSELGYETGAFTANPWTSRYFGFDEGFDHFEDFIDESETDDADDGDESDSTLGLGLRLLRGWSEETMLQDWGSFYEDALAWTEQASEPYFLWLFLVDVHMPYLPVEGYRSQSRPSTYAANLWLYLTGHDPGMFEAPFKRRLLGAYEDTIRYTDDYFQRFVDDLTEDDPMVVFHADHGEAFGEHGIYGHGPDLSEEQIHVPLFVANGPTGEVEEPFSLRKLPDLLTTLATDGDPTKLTDPVVGSRNRDPKFGVRGRDWKYVDADGDATLYQVDGGEAPISSNPELENLGQVLVDQWQSNVAERDRVTAATKEIAATEQL
ncbi:sulfatase [Haloarculaceae archaeon H-GB2-1]|nr:sulfatase [Haloarculaceae archaeon H-GB1-1]MEA5389569.1 sulfatase [Haloarculaceae archaeon H-GB11]MEA5409978.1 sulfatase [Haloarculaceae archaeon H-GB2-1]